MDTPIPPLMITDRFCNWPSIAISLHQRTVWDDSMTNVVACNDCHTLSAWHRMSLLILLLLLQMLPPLLFLPMMMSNHHEDFCMIVITVLIIIRIVGVIIFIGKLLLHHHQNWFVEMIIILAATFIARTSMMLVWAIVVVEVVDALITAVYNCGGGESDVEATWCCSCSSSCHCCCRGYSCNFCWCCCWCLWRCQSVWWASKIFTVSVLLIVLLLSCRPFVVKQANPATCATRKTGCKSSCCCWCSIGKVALLLCSFFSLLLLLLPCLHDNNADADEIKLILAIDAISECCTYWIHFQQVLIFGTIIAPTGCEMWLLEVGMGMGGHYHLYLVLTILLLGSLCCPMPIQRNGNYWQQLFWLDEKRGRQIPEMMKKMMVIKLKK